MTHRIVLSLLMSDVVISAASQAITTPMLAFLFKTDSIFDCAIICHLRVRS